MNHKITRKTSNEEIDQLLKSKYMEEVELIESSLCKTQENMPIIKPYKESEEKIKEGWKTAAWQQMNAKDLKKAIEQKRRAMLAAAKDLNFDQAAFLRDEMLQMEDKLQAIE